MSDFKAFSHQLTAELDNFLDLNRILREDIERILAQDDADQFWRRNLMRCSWSMIEGLIAALKTFTLKGVDLGNLAVDGRIREILEERAFEPQLDGTFKCSDAFPRTLDNLKETLKLGASIWELPWRPDFGVEGWNNLGKSFYKRNRIAHPKRVEDLLVNDEDLDGTKAGLGWFIETLNRFQLELLLRYSSNRRV